MCVTINVYFGSCVLQGSGGYIQTNKNTTATHLYWEFPLGAYIGNHLNNGASETYN